MRVIQSSICNKCNVTRVFGIRRVLLSYFNMQLVVFFIHSVCVRYPSFLLSGKPRGKYVLLALAFTTGMTNFGYLFPHMRHAALFQIEFNVCQLWKKKPKFISFTGVYNYAQPYFVSLPSSPFCLEGCDEKKEFEEVLADGWATDSCLLGCPPGRTSPDFPRSRPS